MQASQNNGWASYLLTGSVALVLSWSMSGCRFGNHKEVMILGLDTISGFYQSRAQTLKLKVTQNGSTKETSVTTNFIPAAVTSVMTNPVILYRSKQEQKDFLYDMTGGSARVEVKVMPDTSEIAWDRSSEFYLDDKETCLYRERTIRNGHYIPFADGSRQVDDMTIQGTMAILHAHEYDFSGGCTGFLTDFYNCFISSSQCWGSTDDENEELHAVMHEIYDPFVDSGAMNVTDIPSAITLRYEAEYE